MGRPHLTVLYWVVHYLSCALTVIVLVMLCKSPKLQIKSINQSIKDLVGFHSPRRPWRVKSGSQANCWCPSEALDGVSVRPWRPWEDPQRGLWALCLHGELVDWPLSFTKTAERHPSRIMPVGERLSVGTRGPTESLAPRGQRSKTQVLHFIGLKKAFRHFLKNPFHLSIYIQHVPNLMAWVSTFSEIVIFKGHGKRLEVKKKRF